jgi:hypothetical protein
MAPSFLKSLPLLLVWCTTILARADPTPALFHPNLPTSSPQHLSTTAHRHRHTPVVRPDGWDDLDLLDLVLIQTIDGALHALERKTGVRLWSRDAFSAAGNMTGVVHMRVRPQGSYTGDGVEPVYILDPQDGQLYVFLPDEGAQEGEVDARLQRLPITMEQLCVPVFLLFGKSRADLWDRIDLSPFTFPQEHSHVFIGSKTTSMRAIDLQTGQDVSSFSPPNATAQPPTASPDACEWNAEWGFREGECESDIDERPEDKLFIGQTCTSSFPFSFARAHALAQPTSSASTPTHTASSNN